MWAEPRPLSNIDNRYMDSGHGFQLISPIFIVYESILENLFLVLLVFLKIFGLQMSHTTAIPYTKLQFYFLFSHSAVYVFE